MTTPHEAERLARVELSRLFEPGEPRLTRAVAQAGGVAVLASTREVLARTNSSGERDVRMDAETRVGAIDPARDLERAASGGIRFVIPGDGEWPRVLDDLAAAPDSSGHGGPPVGLWVRGCARLDQLDSSVAVVGSRNTTMYGVETARELGAELAAAGLPVVSGGALGIDQAAHRGALAGHGTTVAFLAGGVDRYYPRANEPLLAHLAKHGALVSESPPGTIHYPNRFLARNRLIAAMSAGTVVVEAALRSGALSTARWAEAMSRPVMGIPGPVTSHTSRGVHEAIRSGMATLVTCGADVAEVVGRAGQGLLDVPRGDVRPRDSLSQRQRRLLEAVPVDRPAATESIAAAAGIALVDAAASIDRLAQRGFVERAGAGWVLGARHRTV